MTLEGFSALNREGYQARIVSNTHLAELQEGIEGPRREGLLDPALDREYLSQFRFDPPDDLPAACSVVVVAAPDPAVRFTFHWHGAPHEFVVPPTYLNARGVDEHVRDLVAELLAPAGYQVVLAIVPKKLLAVRSGLAAYGRNNVSYVPGLGSFYRPVALYSDLPCSEDGWQAARVMDRCERCTACLHRCPNGAIVADRFLIHAERCLTFYNEKPGDVPFADEIDLTWHNALVGCMHCQQVCPENRDVLHRVRDGATFSEEETGLLLQGTSPDRLPAALADKLRRSDLLSLIDVLPRNLRALLA